MPYRLSEALFRDVTTGTVSTSDIDSENLITEDVDTGQYSYMMVVTVDLEGDFQNGNEEEYEHEYKVPMRSLADNVRNAVSVWNRFSRTQKGLPAFYIGEAEVDDFDENLPSRFLPPFPVTFDYEDYADYDFWGEQLRLNIYFNKIKTRDYMSFVNAFYKLRQMFRAVLPATFHTFRLNEDMEFYRRDDKGEMQRINGANTGDVLRSLYRMMDGDSSDSLSARQIAYARMIGRGQNTWLDKVTQKGLPQIKERYGMEFSVAKSKIEIMPNAPRYDCRLKAYLLMDMSPADKSALKMWDIERAVANHVILNIPPDFFEYFSLVIALRPKRCKVEPYDNKVRVISYYPDQTFASRKIEYNDDILMYSFDIKTRSDYSPYAATERPTYSVAMVIDPREGMPMEDSVHRLPAIDDRWEALKKALKIKK